jgi:hypothetical protein
VQAHGGNSAALGEEAGQVLDADGAPPRPRPRAGGAVVEIGVLAADADRTETGTGSSPAYCAPKKASKEAGPGVGRNQMRSPGRNPRRSGGGP